MAWVCPSCEAKNKPRAVECENCGTERPSAATPKGQLPAACWYDGGRLDAQGFCPAGRGFPVGIRCPFFCSVCGHRLDWSGACATCCGSRTASDRATGPFGARYETHDAMGRPVGDGQHWVKAAEAASRACTPADNRAGFAEVQRILAGSPAGRTVEIHV